MSNKPLEEQGLGFGDAKSSGETKHAVDKKGRERQKTRQGSPHLYHAPGGGG